MSRIMPLCVTFAVLSIAPIASASMAQTVRSPSPDPDSSTWAIRYGDLDMSRSADVRKLYHRIEIAADYVCRGHGSALPERGTQESDACIARGISEAIRRVGSPDLTAFASRDERMARR